MIAESTDIQVPTAVPCVAGKVEGLQGIADNEMGGFYLAVKDTHFWDLTRTVEMDGRGGAQQWQ